ncbi:MAG: SUMF1/EgtB/PvdO family nonheme iron enzyme [Chloroflexota bacterium]
MRRLALIALALFLLLAVTPAYAQTPTPPPDLFETCLDEGIGKCILQAIDQGGWWLLLCVLPFLAGYAIVRAYGKGRLKSIEKRGEKDGDDALQIMEISDLTIQYLEKASVTYSRFKFRGLPRHVAKNAANRLSLDQVYISIQVSSKSERAQDENAVKHTVREPGEMTGMMEKAEPVQLAEILKNPNNRRLAIIGIAGSGKSTLLQWAGLACARARLGQELTKEQEEFIRALGSEVPVPIFIPLRAYNEYCKQKELNRSVKSLLDFMAYHFSENQSDCEFKVDFFTKHLSKPCFLMFDGMDEVEKDDRVHVRAAIEQMLDDSEQNHLFCLIASRPTASYIPEQMASFLRCDVQRLSPEQRDDLIDFWHQAVYQDETAEGARRAADLIMRIDGASKQVRDLATTPLMVTIFCMVSYSHELPRLRAQLYEDAVEVLLTETIHHEGEFYKGLEELGGMDWSSRCLLLSYIAFKLQEKSVSSLPEEDLVELVWRKFGAEQVVAKRDARFFLRLIAERGGLLESEDEEYGFYTHATFQEFLSGRYLAQEMDPQEQRLFLDNHFEDDQWQETIRLSAGYLSIRSQGPADRFVSLLAGLGKTAEARSKALALAGEALADMLENRRVPETIKQLSRDMLTTLSANPPAAPARLRSRLGLALGEIGDPRFLPVPAKKDPARKLILPELVTIPGGSFQMGTSQDEEQLLEQQKVNVYDDEKPTHPVLVSGFSIARFPVTNAEFELFVEQGGYDPQAAWWSADGRLWRTGAWDSDLSWLSTDELRKKWKDWLARRPVGKRGKPFFWGDPRWRAPNLPVVGVSWFEAEAYANWLKAMTGDPYRLPAEAEWEKAARGPQNALWPWGNTWDAGRCNNSEPEDKIGGTSPVGMYPHGTWPDGPQEMVGNVWEWCQDWWLEDLYQKRLGQESKDPQGLESGSARVVRGGSWSSDRSYARCAFRRWDGPGYFNDTVGFRLVLSPSFTSDL